jgi:hypothetical protein
MLTCSGCRVARFCSADHQKMASRKAALGGNLMTGRHKDVCGVLSKWREVVNRIRREVVYRSGVRLSIGFSAQ